MTDAGPKTGSAAAPGSGLTAGGAASHDVAPLPADAPLLVVRDLHTHFPIRSGSLKRVAGWNRAVDGVGFDLEAGRSLGIVGESGSGKTTVGRTILRLIPATSGSVLFEGIDVLGARAGPLRALRRRMQIIFQDPAGALDPRQRVWRIVSEPLLVHGLARRRGDLRRRAGDLLDRCGLASDCLDRYPHEFSGGQRQRICIARALALNPRLIVCDEPTSALDVSIQAHIINLLLDLQRDLGLAYLFISHDIAVVRQVCQRIAVMRAGRIVEIGDREQVLAYPRHEYTRNLLAAVPVADPRRRRGASVPSV